MGSRPRAPAQRYGPTMRLPVLACFLIASALAGAQPSHNYDLLDVNWTISFNETAGTIAGEVVNTVKLTSAEPEISFHSGKLTIASATVDGIATPWSQIGEDLRVRILKPAADSVVKVKIVYTGKPEAGVYFTN